MKTKPLILITGATATGKTGLSVKIAEYINSSGKRAEIINADSLLFYKELNIGTAKPTQNERKGIPHHLIDFTSISTPMNANEYCEEALPIIDRLHSEEVIPVIVGGSSFYIRALLKGMYTSVPPLKEKEDETSRFLIDVEQEGGWEAIRNELKKRDETSFHNIHKNDRYRTLRALEFTMNQGIPFSSMKEESEKDGAYNFDHLRSEDWRLLHLYLQLPKEEHWAIMKKRAQKMLESGLIEEVQDILSRGYSPDLKPLQSIGYKETISYLNQEMTREELSERIFINTRRLAKSQKTFFAKVEPKKTFHTLNQEGAIIEELSDFLDGYSKDE